MFREMRKIEKKMHMAECERLLLEGEYGFLATVGKDGYPYAIALNFVYLNKKIYFHCAKEGQKIDNIDFNNKVCFSIVGDTGTLENRFSRSYESAVVFGRALLVEEDERADVMIKLVKKYSPEKLDKGIDYIKKALDKIKIFSIDIDHVSGKSNK
jgi:nitroimidazol reductase NimA-like FMN-containing flavoprotein (pyridoxamine 5'-phosphate oxidase superfamily)